jgi:hypothetical protein
MCPDTLVHDFQSKESVFAVSRLLLAFRKDCTDTK